MPVAPPARGGRAAAARRASAPRRTPTNGRLRPDSRNGGSRRRCVFTQCGHDVRIFFAPALFSSSMFAFASSWNMYSLPVRLAGSPLHCSFASTPKLTLLGAQDLEQRAQRLLEVGLERARAAEPHEDVVPGRVEDLEAGRRRRTSAAGRSRGPRCSCAARGGCTSRRGIRARRRSRPGRGARR